MGRKMIRRGLIVLASLLVVGLLAEAKIVWNEKVYYEGIIAYNECADELIEGKMTGRQLLAVTDDANGREHYKYHYNLKFSGEGYDWSGNPTGVTYKGSDVCNYQDNFWPPQPGEPFVATMTETMMIHGSDGSKAKLQWKAHITINANGEVTVDFYDFKIDCKEEKSAPSKGDTVTTKWGKIKSQY